MGPFEMVLSLRREKSSRRRQHQRRRRRRRYLLQVARVQHLLHSLLHGGEQGVQLLGDMLGQCS